MSLSLMGSLTCSRSTLRTSASLCPAEATDKDRIGSWGAARRAARIARRTSIRINAAVREDNKALYMI